MSMLSLKCAKNLVMWVVFPPPAPVPARTCNLPKNPGIHISDQNEPRSTQNG